MFKDNYKKIFTNILIGVGLGVLITGIVLLIFAFISVLINMSDSAMSPLSSVALAVGAYFSAFISGKLIKEKALFLGLIVGGIIFLILSVISAIISKNGITLMSLFHFIITILSSIIGAIMGVNSSNKRKII